MNTILVTGAAGFIGSNLVKAIYNQYDNPVVVGIDSVNDYYDVRLKEERLKSLEQYPNFTFIKGNIADKALIDQRCCLHIRCTGRLQVGSASRWPAML